MKYKSLKIDGQEFKLSDDKPIKISSEYAIEEFAIDIIPSDTLKTIERLPHAFLNVSEAEDVWTKALGRKCRLDGENMIIGYKI